MLTLASTDIFILEAMEEDRQFLNQQYQGLMSTPSSYYSYTAIDGNAYACAFNGKTISRAFSESVLGNDRDNVSPECRGNTATTMSVISSLAKGSVGGLHMLGRETVKNVLANVGITPGKFRVSVDGQEKVYYMADDGEIYTIILSPTD